MSRAAPSNYVGVLASGRRVYVRDLGAGPPLVFAVFADRGRDGKMRLVGRVAAVTHATLRCAHGAAHDGTCSWTERVQATPRAYAEIRAHWWTHVARTAAEVVELRPRIQPAKRSSTTHEKG